jgi:PAS domain S-box-containing protein
MPNAGPDALHVLQLAAARWQAILETARDAIICTTESGDVTLFNRSAEEIFGYQAQEVLGQNVTMLMPSPYHREHAAYLQRYAETGVQHAIGRIRLVEGRRKGGDVFPIELSVSEARVADDVVYTAIIRDMSEHRRMTEDLRIKHLQQAATAKLGVRAIQSQLLELIQEAVALTASSLGVEHVKILELQPSGELLLRAGVGWKEGLVGTAMVDVGRESQAGYVLRSNEPVIVDDLHTETRFSGSAFLHEHGVRSGMSVIIHGPRGPYGILSAHATHPGRFRKQDVSFIQTIANVLAEAIERDHAQTESARFQRIARQRERLADIGALTTKIVHDVGNPLAGLAMLIERLERRIERQPDQPIAASRDPLKQMASTVRRLDALIHEFKSFAREQRLELSEIHLPRFLGEVVQAWEREAAARRIELVLDTCQSITIQGDRDKLRRVLDNLVKNALEAIQQGPGLVRIATAVPKPEKIALIVEDTGPGIPAGLDVFRLFETTKANGTGLGLPIARQIVIAHGGGIDFAHVQPHGTAFTIGLPRHGSSLLRGLDPGCRG